MPNDMIATAPRQPRATEAPRVIKAVLSDPPIPPGTPPERPDPEQPPPIQEPPNPIPVPPEEPPPPIIDPPAPIVAETPDRG
jgi:hypothetical protein